MKNLILWTQEVWDIYIRDFLLYVGILFLIIESTYQRLKVLWQADYRKEGRWQDEVGPLLVAVIVVASFWPVTMFDFLPFRPPWQVFAILWTVMIGARASSGAHELYKRIVETVQAAAARIRGGWGGGSEY